MNEQTNPKRTEDDQSSLERRYVTAKNIAIALFVLVFLCFKYGARVARRDIHFSVLFTRLSAALITKTSRALAAEFDGAGVDIFRCSLIDREAFRSIFSFGGAVNDLEANSKGAQRSIDKAADNARLYAEEVKRHLMAVMEASQPKQEVAANV